ncbi:hypothetical protein [Streptomyces sp. t39]|uniref:hypothetical protein n=1 Tax=Streptomyces sp. t39 TaxID=1828156 RepID=UPI0011CDBD21|nr:hypothetical protein [Streptomyces sp. t39]TXS51628.1 hypothetical protein EAO77_27720 [Streptomyces sp. t39]
MRTGARITAFAAALAAAFGTAYGVGQGVGPVVAEAEPPQHTVHRPEGQPEAGRETGTAHTGEHGAAAVPGGLTISDQGFTLDLRTQRITADRPSELRFTVTDDRTGRTVTDYRREHGKELHLIVASRDLSTYRHLHPRRAADGTWSTPVALPEAGGYRVFADFVPRTGAPEGLTLGADLAVSGAADPAPLPRPSTTARVDGYEVTLKGSLSPGTSRELTLSVSRDGRPVTDLQPYLGAYGHLVALRAGDLAYLHVHPGGEPGDGATRPGPEISFSATAPSKGSYRLFLDFRHEDTVRTAAFTVTTDGAVAPGKQEEPGHGTDREGDGHTH